jgi:signal transduction histidine kinase/ActR/RegA family two-component response regulator
MSMLTTAQGGTILIVDDEPDILIALADLFETDFRVVTAGSGEEGLRLLGDNPDVGVIVSDQRMPGMTGDVFLEKARAHTDAEAILLTGYADLNAVVGAVNRGRIVGYSPKPWDSAALRSMVDGAFERRRLIRELQTERALLHGLLESAEGPVSFKDADGRFVRLNRLKAEALRVDPDAAISRKEAEIAPGALAQERQTAEQTALASAEPTEEVIEEGDAYGPRWRKIRYTPIPGADGCPAWIMTEERDITEKRLAEIRLRQSEKLQALGTLAGGVAHDFNNLLTAILGCLQLAERRLPEDPALVRLVKGATEAAQRGASLTQRLLSFSRQSELKLQTVDANRVIVEMGDLLEHAVGGATIETDLDKELWPARIDADQLELAILNLCINARDAMDGGSITIATRNEVVATDNDPAIPKGAYAVVSVRDHGSGIPPEVLARVFEPFFTTKEVGKGTGLGLSMVYGLVQQADGGIRIDTKVGEGTTIDLYLPRSQSSAPEEHDKPRANAASARIMVVDDDDAVRTVTAAFLRDLGHEVAEAPGGALALQMLERDHPVDLLVTDHAMPGVTGIELAERVRLMYPNLPVLIVTGHAEGVVFPPSLPVLHKPFRQDDLAARIAELVSSADMEKAPS